MIVKCKILSYDEINHNVIVRYYSDDVSENDLAISADKRNDGSPERCVTDYNISLNIKDFVESNPEKIKEFIKKYAPIQLLENKKIKIDHNKLKIDVESLIDKEVEFDYSLSTNNNIEDFVNEIIKDL